MSLWAEKMLFDRYEASEEGNKRRGRSGGRRGGGEGERKKGFEEGIGMAREREGGGGGGVNATATTKKGEERKEKRKNEPNDRHDPIVKSFFDKVSRKVIIPKETSICEFPHWL